MPDILKDKKYKEYKKVSRYSPIPYYYNIVDNKFIYGTSLNLDETTAHRVHKVMPNDTLDSLALYYYNNPTFYWIIADFNKIKDPFIELEEGRLLKIPTFSSIEFKDR